MRRKASMIAVLPVLFSPRITQSPRGKVTTRSSILRKFRILSSRRRIGDEVRELRLSSYRAVATAFPAVGGAASDLNAQSGETRGQSARRPEGPPPKIATSQRDSIPARD